MRPTNQPHAVLKVRRDTMRPKFWRLAWEVPGETTFCYAEGECSAIYYHTMRDAIAAGVCRYGETATKMEM